MRYEPGLNQRVALQDRMREAFDGAHRIHLAAAYAKSSGTSKLLQLEPPRGSRAVVGLGFGISDPLAVEQLEDAGLDVRVVPDGAVSASTFHPKLDLVERDGEQWQRGPARDRVLARRKRPGEGWEAPSVRVARLREWD